ncbi:MAG: phosphatidylglycerophosphatase A [Alphaproteobacteria bacterium]|nr:phosphatidylglycerophosphatase A [Alphaproteobacteria bacterium]
MAPLPAPLVWKSPEVLIATGLGSGRISPASGTWGTLAAWVLAVTLPKTAIIFLLILACAAGFWAINEFQKKSGTHDNGMIVIDEWAGIWVAMLFCMPHRLDQLALAFLLFRIFDVLKPWPVSHFDKNVEGAEGVMLDDIVAGVMAGICVYGYGLWMH